MGFLFFYLAELTLGLESRSPSQEEISTSGKGERDPRPTIIFTTIDHPIMREWALPGVDVEVFPSGLVFEEMDSPAVRSKNKSMY